jgi:DNA-binding transcriptional LysR family regulator
MMNVTPGAVSYLINKARKMTNSTLFYRSREGMVPDNVAKELSRRFENIHKELIDCLNIMTLDTREIVISAHTLLEHILILKMISLPEKVKSLKFQVLPDDNEARIFSLRNKETDIDIGTKLPDDHSLTRSLLFKSKACVLARKGNPAINGSFTLENWRDCQHIGWSKSGAVLSDKIITTSESVNYMQERDILVRSSTSLNMVNLCAHSDMIALVPECIVNHLQSIFPVCAWELPAELQMDVECYIHYHNYLSKDPTMIKLLEVLQSIINE